jgi:hypothetical protein
VLAVVFVTMPLVNANASVDTPKLPAKNNLLLPHKFDVF